MIRKLIFSLFIVNGTFCFSQVQLRISALPKNTPENVNIFMASSLNGWNPNDAQFTFKKDDKGYWILNIPELSGKVDFKFTQGSWETVEGDEEGKKLENRSFTFTGKPQIVETRILGWEKALIRKHTLSKNVHILNDHYLIPQLKTDRRIWIYLPPDYAVSHKKYPVIYMEDGQNLFNDATAFSGEWKVDETMDELFKDNKKSAIIVGIDNGGAERLNEYSPWKNEKYGGGKGDLYADFLAKNLKPYIDRTYRTKKQPENTALIGSSMGGLISFYTGLKYPEIFGKMGIFSPSFWFSYDNLKNYISQNPKKLDRARFYFIAGKKESAEMVTDIQRTLPLLREKGVKSKNIITQFDEQGTHSESYWSQEFGKAYLWLF